MSAHPDFIAGNTRLRARLPALLGRADYDRLAGLSHEAAVAQLAASVYHPNLGRDRIDDGQLLDAVGSRLRALLRGVRGLYGGTAGAVVDVLLARHDLQDTLALLRGARTGQPPARRLAATMCVGALDQPACVDVAAATDGATAVIRLAARHLPDPVTARGLSAAWEQYTLTDDAEELETTIAATAITGWTARLAQVGKVAAPALELVHAECDRANLLAALRDPTDDMPRLLPQGLVGGPALSAVRRGSPALLLGARPGWSQAVSAHARDGDLPALEWALSMADWVRALRELRRGDPLGAAVPVGYVLAAECEARAVRLLLADRGSGPNVRELLVA
ncbi:MAG: V-type ATPase subunit [Pedococcus sp.]